jgi:hypothetical protein
LTFQEYLASRKETYDVSGDVLRLVRASKKVLDIATLEDLQAFLASQGASSVVVLAAASLWDGYLDYERKAKRRARKTAAPA